MMLEGHSGVIYDLIITGAYHDVSDVSRTLQIFSRTVIGVEGLD